MKAILSLSIAVLISLSSVSFAHAEWKRKSTVVGPKGGVYVTQGTGSCSNGVCTSNQTTTGPRGKVTTRSGQATCANGTCNSTATVTTPAGKVIKRNSTITRN
ncbi:MAG: hypothetical protein ACRCU5_06405 [Rhizobiaceae bacterium]